MTDVLVIGGGMVGVSTALYLSANGHSVTLTDRSTPGRETSFGNAGIIQREAVEPYAFPHDWRVILNVILKRGLDVNYHFSALPELLPKLASYWLASSPRRYARIAQEYSQLIAHSIAEHAGLIDEAAAWDLVRQGGYRVGFRTQPGLDAATLRAERLHRTYGLNHTLLDAAQLTRAEPDLRPLMRGALQWNDPWCISNPGELVSRYAALLIRRGGRILRDNVTNLLQRPNGGWSAETNQGQLSAQHVVIAVGPWADDLLGPLGYRLPLFIKRGYHRHYAGDSRLAMPLMDGESGFVLAPMAQGIRLTTGAEFTRRTAQPTPVQLEKAERAAAELIALSNPVEKQAWMGCRPCTVDMKPIVGAAPKHKNLWLNIGHAHQGFTLGPVCGRLIAELIGRQATFVDPRPFSPERFKP